MVVWIEIVVIVRQIQIVALTFITFVEHCIRFSVVTSIFTPISSNSHFQLPNALTNVSYFHFHHVHNKEHPRDKRFLAN